MSELLPCFEVEPRGEARGLVVWMHGLGASGHDFEDVVPLLELPDVRFVFPHAPRHAVTINGGLIMPAWYDIRMLGAAGAENADHVRDSALRIEELLERERQRVPPDRTVIAGFSQGAAMALFVGARHPERLAGILVLSGYELLPETREAEAGLANAGTPVLFCHGLYDPVVDVARAREAYADCAAAGRPAEWREFPMGHEVCLEEIELIRDWLHARLADPHPLG